MVLVGSRSIRSSLDDPDIQVVDVDLLSDRKLVLRHTRRRGVPPESSASVKVLAHARKLWGYDVKLEEV